MRATPAGRDTPSVLTEPADVDREALTQLLTGHWSVRVASLDYLAVGFGSHHWVATDDRAGRWFVTVDDLRNARWTATPYDQVRRAFETARALHRDAGLEFVLAPTPDDTGAVVRHLGAHHSMAVFRFLDATNAEFGEFPSVADRRAVLGLVGRLHAATDRIPADLPRREDFDLPGRRHLLAAMAQTDEPWHAGPFGEPTRELLRSSAAEVHKLLRRYDDLAAAVVGSAGSWVITHGEPHAANVLTDRRGARLLIDWDTVAVGPRERDLWMLTDDTAADWDAPDRAAYAATAGDVPLSTTALALYRTRWALEEICEYVSWFRGEHVRSRDTETGWSGLSDYLPVPDPLLA